MKVLYHYDIIIEGETLPKEAIIMTKLFIDKFFAKLKYGFDIAQEKSKNPCSLEINSLVNENA